MHGGGNTDVGDSICNNIMAILRYLPRGSVLMVAIEEYELLLESTVVVRIEN